MLWLKPQLLSGKTFFGSLWKLLLPPVRRISEETDSLRGMKLGEKIRYLREVEGSLRGLGPGDESAGDAEG
jgi:hypothetical protein